MTTLNLCRIFGTVRDAAGRVRSNTLVSAQAVTPQVNQGALQYNQAVTTVTDGAGYFELFLERLVQVNFVIEDTGVDITKTVPDLASQDFTTWA